MNLKQVQLYNKKQSEIYKARTNISVDIQNIGKNTLPIAVAETPSIEEIGKGIFLKKDVINFLDGNFTNVYDLSWDAKNESLEPYINSEAKPYYMLDIVEKDPSILAVMNGSFFFLVDFPEREPKDYPFHFCVRNGKIFGLLSSDEPVLYVQNGKLNAKNTRAFGKIKIGEKTLKWRGINHNCNADDQEADVILYNSGSAKLIKEFDPKTGVRVGRVDQNSIHTKKDDSAVDLVVNRKKDKLVVSEIIEGGGTHLFEGLFILQTTKKQNSFKKNDVVTPLYLHDLRLNTISSAITINKSVFDPYFYTPERINSRDARSVIAEDKSGNIHFVVFDGSKYIPNFRGVSANDVRDYFSPDKYNWSFFVDGGSSSRIITRKEGELSFHANEFAFKKITNEIFLWDTKRHRKLASFIALKTRKN
jgi:hypothetical protein